MSQNCVETDVYCLLRLSVWAAVMDLSFGEKLMAFIICNELRHLDEDAIQTSK